jgi:hypothetical protein
MTTIVADLESMAADQRISGGHMFKAFKIQRIKGSLYGGCGNWEQLLKMYEWFRNPDMKPDWKFQPEFEIIQLSAEGIFMWGPEMIACPVLQPYYATGSGGPYAMGALEAGADLRSAVQIAAKYDSATGHGVQVVQLQR